MNIASPSPSEKRPAVAPRIFDPELRLPAHLRSLPAHAREAIGRAIDAGIARLVLDASGRVLVARAAR